MNRLLKYSCLREIYKQNVHIANYTNSCSNPPRRSYGAPEIKQATLCNGVKVASSRNDQPLAMLTITCQAGSRFEQHNERGVTHFLRNTSSLTGRISAFTRKRDFQQMGIYFTATGGKEFISYTIMGGKSNLEVACRYLVDAVFHNEFRPWEIDDLRSQILLELDTTDPRSQVLDMLHQVAFRGGLGNSIYCPRHKLNEIDHDSIRNYIENNYTSNRCFISSVGLDDGLAVYIGESLNFKKDSPASCFGVTCAAPYLGRGEAVRMDEGQRTVVALGVRAGGDRHALAARAALACGARSALRTQFRALGAEADFFSVDYDGIGLFGVLLETEGHKLAQVCTRAADFLKSDLPGMDELTARRAKTILETFDRVNNDNLLDRMNEAGFAVPYPTVLVFVSCGQMESGMVANLFNIRFSLSCCHAIGAVQILPSDILWSVELSGGALCEMVLQMARGVYVQSINELLQSALAIKEIDIIDSAKTISRNVSELTVAAYGDVRRMPSVHGLRSV